MFIYCTCGQVSQFPFNSNRLVVSSCPIMPRSHMAPLKVSMAEFRGILLRIFVIEHFSVTSLGSFSRTGKFLGKYSSVFRSMVYKDGSVC